MTSEWAAGSVQLGQCRLILGAWGPKELCNFLAASDTSFALHEVGAPSLKYTTQSPSWTAPRNVKVFKSSSDVRKRTQRCVLCCRFMGVMERNANGSRSSRARNCTVFLPLLAVGVSLFYFQTCTPHQSSNFSLRSCKKAPWGSLCSSPSLGRPASTGVCTDCMPSY